MLPGLHATVLLQARASIIPSCVLLLRVLKELKSREAKFACISSWVSFAVGLLVLSILTLFVRIAQYKSDHYMLFALARSDSGVYQAVNNPMFA